MVVIFILLLFHNGRISSADDTLEIHCHRRSCAPIYAPLRNNLGTESFIQRALGQHSRSLLASEAPRHLRPNAGGKPEIVQFGILCKKFYGMDLSQGEFTADLVLTVKWRDTRALALLEAGHLTQTVSARTAASKMWLPDIVVTNRAFEGIDIISTSITVSFLGTVTKTQRLIAILKNHFDVRAYPFDRQLLTVRVASGTLMSDELKLAPINDSSIMGVNDEDVGKEEFSNSTVFEEIDGSLRKSRGQFLMSITRDHMAVVQTVMVSEMLLLFVSWAVFFFPISAPFIMPRVATSIISYLALMTISSKTSAMLPSDGSNGLVWIELFNECCQILLFMTFGFNILVECADHSWKTEDLAERCSFELKLLFPIAAAISLGFCLFFRDGSSLVLVSYCTRSFLTLVAVIYAWSVFSRASVLPWSPRQK